MVRFLLTQNADIEAEDQAGRTPHFFARDANPYDSGVTLLDALNITFEVIVETSSWTPLHASAALPREYGRITLMVLETEFRDINTRDRYGRTPLHWACKEGDASAVELLLQ